MREKGKVKILSEKVLTTWVDKKGRLRVTKKIRTVPFTVEIEEDEERKVEHGNRVYNGLPSELMNKIYDQLIARDDQLTSRSWWAVFSLYLARACGVVERQGR